MFLSLTSLLLFALGIVLVASNPAPHYGAFFLTICAGLCCSALASYGLPFLALVLFLIYLGGILVVFAFAVAFSSEPDPKTALDREVFEQAAFIFVGLIAGAIYLGPPAYKYVGAVSVVKEFLVVRVDIGVVVMYSAGGALMLLCAWVLFLTLFVVLELTRGLARGTLRNLNKRSEGPL